MFLDASPTSTSLRLFGISNNFTSQVIIQFVNNIFPSSKWISMARERWQEMLKWTWKKFSKKSSLLGLALKGWGERRILSGVCQNNSGEEEMGKKRELKEAENWQIRQTGTNKSGKNQSDKSNKSGKHPKTRRTSNRNLCRSLTRLRIRMWYSLQ